MDYEDQIRWEDAHNDAMEDESLMEDDDDSIERFADDRRSSNSEFLRGLPRSSRQQKAQWSNDSLDDKGDFQTKSVEKNIVHKNFFNSFEDDFDDQDLK